MKTMKNKWVLGVIVIGLMITSCESRTTILERKNKQINDSIRVTDSLQRDLLQKEQNTKDSINYVAVHEKVLVWNFNGFTSLMPNGYGGYCSHSTIIMETKELFLVDFGFKTIFGPRILKYKKVKVVKYPHLSNECIIATEVYETSYPEAHLLFLQSVTDDGNIWAAVRFLWKTD